MHSKIKTFIQQFYTENKKLNTYALNDFLIDYFTFQPDFVVQTMIKLLESPQRNVRSAIAYHMKQLKDPKFVSILLTKLDFKDRMISNYALDTLLNYNVVVVNQVITELNKLNDCSEINYLDLRNSLIAKKVSKEDYRRYKCGNE